MITLSGTLYKIVPTENTDRKTGEITKGHTAEILSEARGKTEVVSLKLDSSVVDAWKKCLKKDISIEVRPWALRTETGVNAGLALADKKALPVFAA